MTRGQFAFNQNTEINRWQIFLNEWNQKWNYYVASVVVLFLFLLLVGYAFHDNMVEPGHQNQNTRMLLPKALFGWTPLRCCKIIFQNDDITNLKNYIDNESTKMNCSDGLNLELSNVHFDNDRAQTTWYQHSMPVCEIIIVNSNVRYIEDYSFNAPAFRNLRVLTLVKLPLEHLRKNIFDGLSQLDQFNMREMNENLRYDPDFLLNFIHLGTLQIQSSITNPEILLNITGSPDFDYIPVQTVDLRYNRLMKYLPQHSFRSSSLQLLYLDGAGVSDIHPNAFMFARNIKLVQISTNKFQTLSEDAFANLNNLMMEIKGNDWICDCHLLWLKNQQIRDRRAAHCIGQSIVPFDQGDFSCASTSTVISTTTSVNEEISSTITSISSTSGTTLNEDIISTAKSSTISTTTEEISTTSKEEITSTTTEETATSGKTEEPITNIDTTSTSTISSSTVSLTTENSDSTSKSTKYVEETSISSASFKETDLKTCELLPESLESISNVEQDYFEIEETNDRSILVRCRNKKTLLWFNSVPMPQNSCTITTFGAPAVIKGLQPDTAYIVCAEPDPTSKSIDYCKAIKTQPTTEERSWLQNKHKLPIIITGIIIILALLILTTIIVFFCIRQHPQVLRGNKRVILVKTPTTDVLVMPPKKRLYVSPSPPEFDVMDVRNVRYHQNKNVGYLTRREPGYMTPISRQYMHLSNRPPLARSLSETSTWTVASYVTENQMRSWRKHSQRARTPVSSVFGSPTPPPLPPPRKKSTEIEFEFERDYW